MARVKKCPNCGAAATAQAIRDGACSYCGSGFEAEPTPANPGAGDAERLAALWSAAGGARVHSFASRIFGIVILFIVLGVGFAIYAASRAVSGATDIAAMAAATTVASAPVVLEPSPPPAPEPAPVEPPAAVPAPAPEPTVAEPTPPPEPEPPPKATRPEDFPPESWQRLKGCLCRTDLDNKSGDESIQLALHSMGGGITMTGGGMIRESRLAFAVFAGQAAPAVLATTAETAPPSVLVGSRMGIGIACAGGHFLVGSQGAVSAWSLPGPNLPWRHIWTTPLDGTFPRGASEEHGVGINCAKLPVSRGHVWVDREGQSPLRLNIEDGSTGQ